MIYDYFDMAYRNMRHRKKRSYLTIIGIVIGIAAIVALISLGTGLQNAVEEQFGKLGADSIRIVPGSLRGPPVGVTGLTTKDAEVLDGIHGIKYITPMLFLNEQVEYSGEKAFVPIIAYPTDNAEQRFSDFDVSFYSGRPFSGSDKKGVNIGFKVSKDAFDKELPSRAKLRIKGEAFEVVGVFGETGTSEFDNNIYMPIDAARDLFGKPDEVNVILVRLDSGAVSEDVAEDIIRVLKRSRGNENFDVFTPEQILEQLGAILGVVRLVLAGIAAISLLVGGIGIMNAMYTSVLERTREIGIIKSIGARKQDIVVMFLIEAGFVGLVGGLIGAFSGFTLSYLMGVAANYAGYSLLKIVFDAELILFSISFAFLVGVLSGVLPALRAASLEPAEALRYE